MTQIGAFPAGLSPGQPEAVGDVVTMGNQIKAVVNGGLDSGNLAASAGILDTQLASPTNAAYRPVFDRTGSQTAVVQNTYVCDDNSLQGPTIHGGGILYLDPADYAVAGKTTKYRLRAMLGTNATAPTSTFTFGLYPVTAIAGGAGVVVFTLGAVTSGSTVAFVAPGASSLNQNNSGDFTAPSDGYYVAGVAITVANMVANSAITYGVHVQRRNV
jgi:hypothetical protein